MELSPKTLFFIFALAGMFLLSAFKPADDAPWLSDYDAAISQSAESGQPVLMIFSGSDWCRPCMMLRRSVLESEQFTAFAEKELILLEVDFPRSRKNKLSDEQIQHNEQLAERFNRNGLFPMILLLDAEEAVIGRTHEPSFTPDEFVARLESWIEDSK